MINIFLKRLFNLIAIFTIILAFPLTVFCEVIILDSLILFAGEKLEGERVKVTTDIFKNFLFQEKIFFEFNSQAILYINKIEKNKLMDVYLINENDHSKTIKAEACIYKMLPEENKIQFKFINGVTENRPDEDKIYVLNFGEYFIDVLLDEICPEGVIKEYYDNGKLKSERIYENCILEGFSKIYFENGNLKGEQQYINGKKEGLGRSFYEDGTERGEWNFMDNKLNGVMKSYYKNGKLSGETIYKNNEPKVSKSYDSNGIFIREEYY